MMLLMFTDVVILQGLCSFFKPTKRLSHHSGFLQERGGGGHLALFGFGLPPLGYDLHVNQL